MKTLVEKYKGFNIYFESLPEETAISELLPDDTEEQRQEVIRNNEIFVAKVTAEFNSFELASDYLGGCIYESEEDFYIKYKSDYFTDMKETVTNQAIEEAANLIEDLKEII